MIHNAKTSVSGNKPGSHTISNVVVSLLVGLVTNNWLSESPIVFLGKVSCEFSNETFTGKLWCCFAWHLSFIMSSVFYWLVMLYPID